MSQFVEINRGSNFKPELSPALLISALVHSSNYTTWMFVKRAEQLEPLSRIILNWNLNCFCFMSQWE